jgi:DNA-binding winged helix-turn-helix (wHTH) protein
MDRFGSVGILLFEGYRLDRRGGGLFRLHHKGAPMPIHLGARALDLLALLAERAGEVVLKDSIMRVVWPGKVVEEANLNVQISKLRQILDQNREHGSCIQTVTRYGYRFVARVTRIDPTAIESARAGLDPVVDDGMPDCEEAAHHVARSTRDLMIALAAVIDREANVHAMADIWGDTTTPQGRLMLAVLRGLARFERDLIHARTTDKQGRVPEVYLDH